ncbi:MAG: hypothetical protein IPG80_18770 [Anaerolineales bacterium]|jgi:hypothetical protein|uniref:hypothetical protein n=1 Tax=Candidatus Villigracilis vicinus TaxID=3140679 RepID=UPI003137172A|nr:hypothetical protein [Anaerolineales bacterium]MBK7447980.1 hypothetical protein [Anaerolineales bacterium]MBK9778914.1 hypothetical protein [Anaerolineales bacterium]
MQLSENGKWFVEKVLIPLLVAAIAAYATLTVAGIFPSPFGKSEARSATFSSLSSNSSVNSLNEGQVLTSPNKQHELKIENGNVILYSNGSIAWMTNTEWSGGNHLVMQGDGNLVLYADERFVWNTDTPEDPPAKSYTFSILDNGNLVVSNSTGKMIWSIK